MKFKIHKSTQVYPHQYFILYKKNFLTRWKFFRRSGLVVYWKTKNDAEKFIEEEKKRFV